MTSPKILVIDIETKAGKGYIWRMFDEVRNIEMLIEPTAMLSWAAKWVGEDYTYFDSIHRNDKEGMLENMWKLLDEADVVVGWNSNRFDIRHINAAFVEAGMPPPSPYAKLDLLATVKSKMSFMSNKLDYVSGVLGIGHKLPHSGWSLWEGCRAGDKQSWATMEEYNIQDVELTEQMYEKLRPWLPVKFNRSIEAGHVCPECGGTHLHSKGVRRTPTMLYDRWHCVSCGSWSQSVSARKDKRATLKKEAA